MQTRVSVAALLGLLLLAGGPVLAETKLPMDLPTYPGGESTMEVNLSNEDILPMVKAMLPLMGDKLGKLAEQISPEEIADVLKDVTQIEFRQVDIAKPGVAERDIADFYSKHLPTGNWNRVFLQSLGSSGTIAVYAQPGGEMLYGFRVRTVKQDDKLIKRAEVAKIDGKIDYAKLIALAAKVLQATKAGK